jgi:hypothetical protein
VVGASLLGSAASAAATAGTGGGGNTVSDSVGAAQLGGGNTVTSSFLAAQSGALTAGADAGAGGTNVSTPASVGGSGGNSASDSLGTVQIGGGNNSMAGSIGTVQAGSGGTAPSPGGGGGGGGGGGAGGGPGVTGLSFAAPLSPASVAGVPTPNRATAAVPSASRRPFGAANVPSGTPRLLGQLPFTGLALLLFAVLGLALLAAGSSIRARMSAYA